MASSPEATGSSAGALGKWKWHGGSSRAHHLRLLCSLFRPWDLSLLHLLSVPQQRLEAASTLPGTNQHGAFCPAFTGFLRVGEFNCSTEDRGDPGFAK